MQLPSQGFCSISIAHRALSLAIIVFGTGTAQAGVAGAPAWSFGGFGSIGAVHSSEQQADFTSTVLKASGAGFSRAWSNDVDSRLGAQLDLSLNKRWSAVLQVVSEQRLDNTYRPAVEWANIKYQATPELSVRVGRIALPMFLAADYRKVGYAYPWVRTPVEVYGVVPLTNSDGIDLSYRWTGGGLKNVTQAFYGATNMKLYDSSRLEARGLVGVSNTTEYGAASARLSILSAELTLDIGRQVFAGFRQFGPRGAALADRYEVDKKRIKVISLGASYDPGHWFVMGELADTRTGSFLGEATTLYASSGYRFGNFTPYITYSRIVANSPASDPGLALTGMPPAMAAGAAQLNAYLNMLLSTIPNQSTVSAGARWDLRPSMALKVQYDRVLPTDGSRGTLINTQAGFRSGRAANVASVVLDFVY